MMMSYKFDVKAPKVGKFDHVLPQLMPLGWSPYPELIPQHPPVKTFTGILQGVCGQESPCTYQFTILHDQMMIKKTKKTCEKYIIVLSIVQFQV